MSSLYASKLKLPVVFQKRNWNFAFAFEHLWLGTEFLNVLFPLKFHPGTLETQLNYLKTLCDNAPLTVQQFGHNIVTKVSCCIVFPQAAGSSFPFWRVFWFFPMILKNIEHLITLVNSNAASSEPLIIFIALMVSPTTNWRPWPWQFVEWTQSRLYMLLLLAPTMLDAQSGPTLDL